MEATTADAGQRARLTSVLANLASSNLTLLAILLASLIAYAPSINDWFSADDFWFLASADRIPFWHYVADSFDPRETGTLPEFNRYRPLYPITWWLQYQLFALNAPWYHGVLVALHLASVIFVWLIVRRLTRLTWAANLAAFVFGLHPAYTTAVVWLSGGNRIFATLPYLVSLFLFMQYADGGRWRMAYYLGSLAAFVIAILYHSTALTLSVMLPAYYFLFARSPRDATCLQEWPRFAPFFVVTLSLIGLQFWVRTHLGIEQGFTFGWHMYRLFGAFIGMAVFPLLVTPVDPGFGDFLRKPLEAVQGLGSVAAIIAFVVLLTHARWGMLCAFAGLWFVSALLLDTTSTLGAYGRLLYMSGPAIALLLVVLVLALGSRLPSSAARLIVPALPVVVLCAAILAVLLIVHHAQPTSDAARADEQFITGLRAEVPSLEPGAVLYVVGAPSDIVVFGQSKLDALVRLYYGDVSARNISNDAVAEVRAQLRPIDRVYINDNRD